MADKPEERARAEIDRLLAAAGWSVQSIMVPIFAERELSLGYNTSSTIPCPLA